MVVFRSREDDLSSYASIVRFLLLCHCSSQLLILGLQSFFFCFQRISNHLFQPLAFFHKSCFNLFARRCVV